MVMCPSLEPGPAEEMSFVLTLALALHTSRNSMPMILEDEKQRGCAKFGGCARSAVAFDIP